MLKRPERRNDYCSNKCKGPRIAEVKRGSQQTEATKARISAANRGRPAHNRKLPTPILCAGCGTLFEIPGRDAARAAVARFCTHACWLEYGRHHPEVLPNWRGGKDPYYGPTWHKQARLARERDGHTCQDCGRHQRRPLLDVHHLTPRRAFGGDYEAAHHLDNLITICHGCHTRREAAITRAMRSA